MTNKNKHYYWLTLLVILIILISWLSSWQKTKETNKSIKVGAILPLSGIGSFYGLEMQKGLDMCNPGNIKYVFEDSASEAKTGVSAFTKVTKIDKVDTTIIGLSTVVPAILPIAKENKNFVITSIVSAPNIGEKGGETVFRYFTDGANEAKILAEFITKTKGLNNIGIMYLNNEFGLTYKNSMEEFFKNNIVTYRSEYFSPADTDFSTSLLKLKEQKVKAIFIAAYDKQTLQIIKQIQELGIDVNIFTEWVMANPEFHKGNEKLLEGVYFTSPLFYFSKEQIAIKFNQEYLNKYNKGANIYSAIGCDLAAMIGKNNLKDYKQLQSLKNFTGINGDVSQQEFGEFSFPLKVVRLINGLTQIEN